MRLRPSVALPSWFAFASLLHLSTTSSSSGITLSRFQQITAFSTSCTAAYNTPIPGCTTADFVANNPCSLSCIRGLQTITALLDSNCQGLQADPGTLIGMFFQGQGVKALCPNAGSPGGSQSTSTVSVAAISTLLSSASTDLSPSTTSSTSSTPSSTPPTASGSTSSSGPTQTAASFISASSGSPATTPAGNSFTTTVANQGSATVLTSKADQTASTSPAAFGGGGGSPFDISSGVRHMVVDMSWLLYGTSICMVAIWWI